MESSFTERRRMTRSGIYHCLYDTDGISTRQSLAQSLGLSLPPYIRIWRSWSTWDSCATAARPRAPAAGARPGWR